MPGIQLPGTGQFQVDHPEIVSHEKQYKVSVRTEIFVEGEKFDNVFATKARQNYYPS